MADIGKDIAKAKRLLEAGELVAIPTETVYGLAANALDEDAVAKIFEVKDRPGFDPLIVHAGTVTQISGIVEDIPGPLLKLAEKFWPGPLTLLMKKKPLIPYLVTSGLENVAVRVPDHPMTGELLRILDFPLAAPSANPFGYISPTLAEHVQDQLGEKIPYILDGGHSEVGLESTIVGMDAGRVFVFRLGGTEVSAIEDIVGEVTVMPQSSSNPKSPGMLKSHYAPRKSFVLGDIKALAEEYKASGMEFAIFSFQTDYSYLHSGKTVVLSKDGDYREAAKKLFAAMRFLDNSDASVILAEALPEEHLGKAINDRLRRAAAK